MTSRRFILAGISRWASISAVLVLLPSTVFATHFELSRLANEVELISDKLADDLRYTRHYGSVRQRAVTLRREASQLAESLRRNRSNSRIRSQFKDVRRGYERLEQAFFIADRRDHDPLLYREINLLSNVFTSLRDEYYYAGFGGQSYTPGYIAPYSGIAIIGSRNSGLLYSGPRNYGSRNYGSRNYGTRNNGSRNSGARSYDRRDQDSRSNGRIVPNRERAIPPVFRGNSGSGITGRNRDRDGRVDRGSRSVQSAPSLGHSSRVLERQGRQNSARRELESQARGNRSSATADRQSRGANVQRGRSSRGAVSETRRRNHYE